MMKRPQALRIPRAAPGLFIRGIHLKLKIQYVVLDYTGEGVITILYQISSTFVLHFQYFCTAFPASTEFQLQQNSRSLHGTFVLDFCEALGQRGQDEPASG